ncbi:MAG: MoaD/ThiS family protein [Deltaproteobacteria bacterium]|nr:MoaD/ThiS family protein [Deltaproteobacteria bacterium]
MIVYVKSHGFPQKYTGHLPDTGELMVPEGSTVKHILRRLKVPDTVRKVIFVNGRHKPPDHILHPEDILVFFPPLEGG